MADQNNRPYRGAEPPRISRPSASGPGQGDPLAELARLIGQNDPFSDLSRPDPSAQRAYPHRAAAPDDWSVAQPHAHEAAPPQQPYAGDPRYDAQRYGETYPAESAPFHAAYPAQDHAAYDAQGYPPAGSYDADPYYVGEAEPYQEEVRPRRRGGFTTALVVIALALIGTAGAFGYRAIFSGPNVTPPPVIKADTAPAKIVPAATPNEQSKQIYDRVGDRSQAERVVARQEAPVDVKDVARAAPRPVPAMPNAAAGPVPPPPGMPATMPPAGPAPAMPPVAAAPAMAPAAPMAAVPPAPGPAAAPVPEPKRVRTVTIRPDQPGAAPAPARPNSAAAASPQPARVASAEPVEPAPAPMRNAATRSLAAAPSSTAPLSLAPPGSGPAPIAPRSTTMRTASAPAAAPATEGGSFVQVSSQRSEADAQAAFRALRAKYPDVFGDHQPVIRRADLGDKGVFFRAQVGPFASIGQATEFCSSLKAAGGECVVQRN